MIIDGSGSGKINVLLNLIEHQRPDVEKLYLYVIDLFESKHQLLIKRREKQRLNVKNPKIFIVCSQKIDDVYENFQDNNTAKEGKVLIELDDMIADAAANEELSPIVT